MCFNMLTNSTGFAFLPFLVVRMLICLNPFSSTCLEISHLALGAKKGDQYISTELFMQRIWGYDSESEINVVWVYISYLRKKLSSLNAELTIKATRNMGYTLSLDK